MANTRIVLNKQSDLILTEAQIVAPSGIVEADIAGLVAHFQAVEQSIAQEVARATNEDAKHDNEIEAEESSRIAGDSSLESKIDADVKSEKDARESADASLEQELGEYIDSSIKTEVGQRESADTSLEAKVSTEKGRIDAILSAATADSDSFAEIVTLINSVDTENDQAFASYVLSNNAAVSTEVSSRESADASLEQELGEYIDKEIKSEVQERSAADASLESKLIADISTEKAGREFTDAFLEQKIDEEKSRAIAKDAEHNEAIDELNESISSEESSRVSADTSLETKINDHVVKLEDEDKLLSESINAEESSRVSADASLETKINDHVGKLEDEDKLLSESINAEESSRVSADASLEAKVSTEKGRIDAILLASDADKDSFAEIVSLINSVDTENDDAFASYVVSNNAVVSELNSQIAQETQRAVAKDAEHDNTLEELTDSITAEESTRLSVDEAIKTGVNAALVEIKSMLVNAIQLSGFRVKLVVDGDGVNTTFGASMFGNGALYLNGLLQIEGFDYTTSSSVDEKGNPLKDFIFNTAPDNGSKIVIYGREAVIADPNSYGDATPLA